MRRALSSFVENIASTPANAADVVRDQFSATVLPPPVETKGHTHPTAAAIRSAATLFAANLSAALGVRLYSIQMSKSDQRRGYAGSREWHWAKDTNVQNRQDTIFPSDLAYMCDVDYYVDMPGLLASSGRTLLLYTTVPSDACGTGIDDTSFYFDEQGKLVTLVAGGGKYEHPLWDYGSDSVIAIKKVFGIPIAVSTYAIERRQLAYSRQVILLTPLLRWQGIGALLASVILDGRRLSRFNPVVTGRDGDKFIRFRVHTSEGTKYTTSRPGNHLCATVDAKTDDAVGTAARLGSTHLQLPTTSSWLGKDHRAESAVLTEYYRSVGKPNTPTVYPTLMGVRDYQFEPRNYDQESRAKTEAFMSPLVHGAFAPVVNAASERRCVEGRINSLRKPEPKYNRFVSQCMAEFAELVVGDAVLEPVSVDVVFDKQTRPAQVLSLNRAVVMGPFIHRVLKCFIKSESYLGPKDPRNISQYNDSDKLNMACFALSLSDHLKQFPWYAPGKTPLEIASRVADICQHSAEYVNVSDYHRMDGTITAALRQVERVICMKAFANHRPVLNELLKSNFNNKGVLPHGTTFEQGPSHGSGCSATSTFQTLRAAFTAYLGFRRTQRNDRYMQPAEAFDAIGIHLGDDGLDADLPVMSHEWAAGKVGLVLEAGVVKRGDRGVTFLARYYSPDVWHGALDSCCDVKRQLSKFHTTVRLPAGITPVQKLVEKARGYAAMDGETPVIGALCRKAIALSPHNLTGTGHDVAPWWSKFENSVQYPNKNIGGWMDSDFDFQFPAFNRLGFDMWLDSIKTIEQLLSAPLFAEIEPANPGKVDVVVDGDVVPAQAVEDSEQTPKVAEADKPPRKSARPTKRPARKKKEGGKPRQKRKHKQKAEVKA